MIFNVQNQQGKTFSMSTKRSMDDISHIAIHYKDSNYYHGTTWVSPRLEINELYIENNNTITSISAMCTC